jgi:deoxycytidine triphosphate deaminase
MVLHDEAIEAWARKNVTPFNPARVNPYSLNLTLGAEYRLARTPSSRILRRFTNWLTGRKFDTIKAQEDDLRWHPPRKAARITIRRGDFMLLHSAEYIVMPENAIGLLFLNSTEARGGVEQGHAGVFEAKFKGQAVWEITNNHPQPLTFTVGERFGQMVFFETKDVARVGYDIAGRYNGQTGAQVAK